MKSKQVHFIETKNMFKFLKFIIFLILR